MQALSVSRVRKRYGETLALDDVSLEVSCGETVGLLGPNGAGKTTLIEIICGLRGADYGTVLAFDEAVVLNDKRVWRRMAIALPANSLPPRSRVGELAELYKKIYGLGDDTGDILAAVGLADCRSRVPSKMSNGQKQRLTLALTLLGRPDLMVLDEPTSELDPHGRRTIWDLIREFRSTGQRAVLLATHQMDEAAALCDKVGILVKGRIAAFGPPDDLIARYCPGNTLVFRTSLAEPPQLRDATLMDFRDDTARYATLNLASAMADLIAKVPESGLNSIQVLRPTLEDVFFAVTGESLDG
ncbi:MAG: ABC transporter ATP-binding protein [Allosphingosinicella sp.]